ncbi:SPOR domain-containing protein [Emcibacter sp. SYSU 3D8]|uniref:SPOR domain-containing protein n=1 Tax=Emcibacter sp. SYSU 3D8 TaxID=3133969 RepID=UPI0031FEEC8C
MRLLGTALLLAVTAVPARADFQAGAAAYARGDFRAAIDAWAPDAEQGDPSALFNLGQMHRLGVAVDKDLDKAEEYYRRAAEQGHVGAQANLGSMLYDRDPPQGQEAVSFWQQAARAGDVKSQYLLGVQYVNGDFVARDYVQAHAWLSLAAKAGIRDATEALTLVRTYMDAADVGKADTLAATLVVPPAAPRAATMPASGELASQLDAAVLPNPVDDLAIADLWPISPDAVRGAIALPSLQDAPDAHQAVSKTGNEPPSATPPEPSTPRAPPAALAKSDDSRNVEYRAQFASFSTEREAMELRQSLEAGHARLLGDAGVKVEKLIGGGPQSVVYRVRTGPLKSEAAARAVCDGVSGDKIACQTAKSMRVPVSAGADAELQHAQTTGAPTPSVVPQQKAPAAPAPEDHPEIGPEALHEGDKWRVQVGAGRTEEEARFRWARLMGANADLLDAAELYIYKADLGLKGVFYRVQIGRFSTRPAAIGLCERLKARKVDCFVTATQP